MLDPDPVGPGQSAAVQRATDSGEVCALGLVNEEAFADAVRLRRFER